MIDYHSPRDYNLLSVLKTILLVIWLIQPIQAALPAETTFILENGMRVILSQVPDRQAVAILSYYTTGAQDDLAEYPGFSFFYGSMHGIFTTENQKSYYSFRRLTENGGIMENNIAHDDCYFLQIAAEEELNNALWSESENIFLLSPSETELKSLVNYSAEIAAQFGPHNTLFNARLWMFNQLFLARPGYAAPVIGNPDQIRSWTYEGILEQIKRFKDPARVILVVTGAFDPVLAQDSIQKYFEGMGTPSLTAIRSQSAFKASKSAPIMTRSWWRDNLDQHYLLVGYRIPGLLSSAQNPDEEYFVSRALYHFLISPGLDHLDHMINRVNRLRVTISAEMTDNIHENALLIRFGSRDRSSLEKAKYILTSEIQALANRKISLLQMRSVKAAMKNEFYKKMADLGSRAIEIARSFHIFGQISPTKRFEKNLQHLDQNSIMRVIKKHFSDEKQVLLYVYKKE